MLQIKEDMEIHYLQCLLDCSLLLVLNFLSFFYIKVQTEKLDVGAKACILLTGQQTLKLDYLY